MDEAKTELEMVGDFLATFYHEVMDYEDATEWAAAQLNGDPQYHQTLKRAFEVVVQKSYPPGVLTDVVQRQANRFVGNDDQARQFLEEVFAHAVLHRPIRPAAATRADEPEPSGASAGQPGADISDNVPGDADDHVSKLGDSDPRVVAASARALGLIGDRRAVGPLVALLGDGHDDVRAAAAFSLGQLGAAEAVAPLIRLLGDTDHHVRADASHALGKLGAPAVAPLLSLLARQEQPDEVMRALVAMDQAALEEELIRALRDMNQGVRAQAARVLIQRGGQKAHRALEEALTDGDPSVKHYARIALDVIDHR